MKEYYRVSEAAKLLKVSPSTMRKYTAEGKIQGSRNLANQRVYSMSNLREFIEPGMIAHEERTVYYLRASDGDQARLNTQLSLLEQAHGKAQRVFMDKASGLNEKRKGLASLIAYAKKHEFDTLIITSKDRLTRFGYSYLEQLFNEYNVKILILDEDKEHKQTLEEELLKDFMSLITSFSGKFYRLRGNEQKHQLLDKAREQLS